MAQHYEDIIVGQIERFGHFEVERDEVIAFSKRYDPQPFHLSDEAAAQTHFGRIPASGWQTCAMTMAMIVADMQARDHAGLGGAGVDELRWHKPVYPGDTLSCAREILSKRRSASRPEMGLFRSRMSVYNQHDEKVLSFISTGMVATRDAEGRD